jgi:hypothetical protein
MDTQRRYRKFAPEPLPRRDFTLIWSALLAASGAISITGCFGLQPSHGGGRADDVAPAEPLPATTTAIYVAESGDTPAGAAAPRPEGLAADGRVANLARGAGDAP